MLCMDTIWVPAEVNAEERMPSGRRQVMGVTAGAPGSVGVKRETSSCREVRSQCRLLASAISGLAKAARRCLMEPGRLLTASSTLKANLMPGLALAVASGSRSERMGSLMKRLRRQEVGACCPSAGRRTSSTEK